LNLIFLYNARIGKNNKGYNFMNADTEKKTPLTKYFLFKNKIIEIIKKKATTESFIP
tara:strand:+ start:244 stop:414 length:171 start_codon:yes stop_codon:yes gene_type:complete